MEFRILGPVEALDGDRVLELGGSKQRALLAMFLLHPNESISTDRLIDQLWDEGPPATATKAVQVHIWRLRKVLVAQAQNGADGLLVTGGTGYELRVDPSSIDAQRFEGLIGEARAELAAEQPDRAVASLERALSLWRGSPLMEFTYAGFAQPEIARLNDLRAAALEGLIDAKLALGRHSEVVEELPALVAEHPYRERLRAQLMLALYRCDRQAEALQAYQEARRTLTDELGIEPGSRLREVEAAILRQDQALALPARHGVEPTASPVAGGRSPTLPLLLLVAVLLAVAAVLLTQLGGGGSKTSAAALDSAGNSVAALGPSQRRAAFAVPLPGRPTGVAATGGVAWVTTVDSGSLTSVDATGRTVLRTVPLGGRPDAVAVGEGSVWVADGMRARVLRFKPGYGTVQQTISLPAPQAEPRPDFAIAVAGGGVWVANGTRRLWRIDPGNGSVTAIPIGRTVDDVAASAGAVWALSTSSASVVRVDPRDSSITDRIPIVGRPGLQTPSPVALAVTAQWVWVLNGNTGSVTRIDASSRSVVATTPVGVDRVPSTIAAAGPTAWVANGDGTVSSIDAWTGATRVVRIADSLDRVATDGRQVWVTTTALDQRLPGGKI